MILGLHKAKLDETGTVDELYEAAKEEGKVVIYSMTSRIKDIKESFEAQYPGVEVEHYDMRMAEIFEKFEREHEAGIYTADILFIKDADGVVYNEFFKEGLLHAYIPEDIAKNIPDEFRTVAYKPYFEVKQVYYNTEKYDESPINSWWDLTKPEYKGRVMFGNPIANQEILGLFLTMIKYADEMEADYKEVFGEDIVLNGTKNAGYEWIKRLAENDPILTTSDSDIVKAVGAPGQENPPFGIAVSSKMRDARTKDLLINVPEKMTPRDGICDAAILAVTDQAQHVNAAKLLIRWIGGETDGTGEGFAPFHVEGSWPTRSDVVPMNTPLLDELNLWSDDSDFKYDIVDDVTEFWLTLQ